MTEIKGYKPLTEWQKFSMNQVKELEIGMLNLLKTLSEGIQSVDSRWISISRTHIEQASMAAVRAIAQPETVEFNTEIPLEFISMNSTPPVISANDVILPEQNI